MIEPMGLWRDAASVLLNLPGYRVVDAVDDPDRAVRRVLVESVDDEGACPACGVATARVHQRTVQRVRDIPVAGAVRCCGASGVSSARRGCAPSGHSSSRPIRSRPGLGPRGGN